jgi:ribosomal protein S27AE
MTDYLAAIPLIAMQRLRCPKCQTRLMLAHISPGPTGFEQRAFDCAKCDYVEKIVIAIDLMKSGGVGWLVSELQPSK